MPVPSKAQLAAHEAARATAVEEMAARLGDMAPRPGQFAVTIRIDRPDGQFVTSTRLVPSDMLAWLPEGQAVVTSNIASGFVSAYQRVAELPE